MSRVFKSFDTEIAENLTPSEPKHPSTTQPKHQNPETEQDQDQDQDQEQPQITHSQKRKSAIKKQTFDELYGEPENFLEIEVCAYEVLLLLF